MAVHRQGEGQVALIGEPAFIEAVYQQKQHNNGACGDDNYSAHAEQRGQNRQKRIIGAGTGFLCPGEIPDGTAAQQPAAKTGGA